MKLGNLMQMRFDANKFDYVKFHLRATVEEWEEEDYH